MFLLTAPPSVEPVSLAEAKAHLRVTFADEDTLISALIQAARERCETEQSRSYITTGWRLTLDSFPGSFSRYDLSGVASGYGNAGIYGQIPERILSGTGQPFVTERARLIAVSSITYLDTAGTRQTLSPSAYSVEPGDGGRIAPAYGTTWPATRAYPGSVVVDMTLGYGPNASDVPATVKAAMLLMIGHLYANKEAVHVGAGNVSSPLPMGVSYLLASENWGQRP